MTVHPLPASDAASADAASAEVRHRALLDAMDQGFCIVELLFDDAGRPVDYRFLEANAVFTAQTGLTDVVGRTARALVPDLEAHWFERYGRVATTGEPARFAEGSDAMGRWFEVHAFRIGDPAARQVGVLFTDASARRAAERAEAEARRQVVAALAGERDRLRAIFEQAPSFVAVLRGPAHVFEFANAAYRTLVGDRPLVGRPVREAMPEAEAHGLVARLDHVLATGEPFVARALPVALQRVRGAPPELLRLDFTYHPLVEADGTRSGILVQGVDVTEAARAQEALAAEREQLGRLVDALPVLVTIYDPALAATPTGAVQVNRAFVDTLGWTDDDVRAGDLMARCYPDPAVRARAAAHMQRVDGRWLELPTTAADGRTVPVLWTNVRLAGDRQVGVGLDLTERQAAEARVADSERQLRRVLDHLFTFVGLLAPDGTLLEANRAPLEAAGLALDDVRGRPFWEAPWWAHDPAVTDGVRDAVRRAALGETVRYDVPVALGAHPDGTPRLVVIDFMLAPLRDEAGRVTQLVPSGVDVSPRVEAVRALRTTDAEREAALAAGALGTWDLDLVSGAARVGGRTRELFGYAPDAATNVTAAFFDRVHPDDLDAVREAIRRTVEEDAPHAVEYRVVHPDGRTVRLASRGVLVRDDAGRPMRLTGALVDVTERHAALAAAEAANRAKSDFLASMSHELRTPLNAIQGHVQLLEMELHGPVTDAQRDALARVDRAQRHLLGLISDILNYAKLESGRVEFRVEAVAVREVAADVLAMLEPQAAARGLALHATLPERVVPAWADREKLAQVLLNLLANAVKFTPSGGTVHVVVEPALEAPGMVAVRVHDTGIGIPADQHEAIFAPFVQARLPGTGAGLYACRADGTGLGLAISRDLARGMGGELTVASTEGVGSTFTLLLRAVLDADGLPVDRRAGPELPDAGGRRTDVDRRAGSDRRDGDDGGAPPPTSTPV